MDKQEVKKIIEEDYIVIKRSNTFKFFGSLFGTLIAILGISIYSLLTTLNSKGVETLVQQIKSNKIQTDLYVDSIATSYTGISRLDTINVPLGTIMAFAGDTEFVNTSTKWKICNGDEVDREEFKELFNIIQVNWGAGNSRNTFNLPDFRGQFLRGVDMGTGNDPDAQKRKAKKIAGNSGDKVGSYQQDKFESHTHKAGPTHASANVGGVTSRQWRIDSHVIAESSPTGGNETRPKNAYVLWIIKVR